ncbi:hypothetical protein GTP45_01655 [Pseudoduganella sp. FT55W]|uniref:Uncharacterized protein n=1 Tax=Duganella rivi TaxID=2666083 RepID=A0A7X4GM26_9BURK|nr:hypothetical protein [Duganella rivi]MYM65539.1 hypothetical protein [Duganella rivi]
MDHKKTMFSQLIRLAYSLVFFIAFTAVAVVADLLSEGIRQLGVADFTYYLVALTARVLLVLDVLLFLYAAFFSAWDFLKGQTE